MLSVQFPSVEVKRPTAGRVLSSKSAAPPNGCSASSLMPEQGGAESPPASLVGRDEQSAVAIGHAIWRAVEPMHVGAGLISNSSTGVGWPFHKPDQLGGGLDCDKSQKVENEAEQNHDAHRTPHIALDMLAIINVAVSMKR